MNLPGQGEKVFPDLLCHEEFRKLGWLGIIGRAQTGSVFYVDNLSCRSRDAGDGLNPHDP